MLILPRLVRRVAGGGASAGALPSAARCLSHLSGNVDASVLADDELFEYQRALCAAADEIANYGEGRVGGYEHTEV